MITQENSKTCPRCVRIKPLSGFSPNKNYRLGVGSWCKSCRSEATADYTSKNQERVSDRNSLRHARGKSDPAYMARRKASRRRYKVKKKYGMTQSQLDQIMSGLIACPCCGRQWGPGMSGPAVDHDHGTNKFRGIICRKCNAGIGLLGDSVKGLMSALSYLNGANR